MYSPFTSGVPAPLRTMERERASSAATTARSGDWSRTLQPAQSEWTAQTPTSCPSANCQWAVSTARPSLKWRSTLTESVVPSESGTDSVVSTQRCESGSTWLLSRTLSSVKFPCHGSSTFDTCSYLVGVVRNLPEATFCKSALSTSRQRCRSSWPSLTLLQIGPPPSQQQLCEPQSSHA